jgi:hypothetical protein
MATLETSPGDLAQKAANDMGRLLKQEIDGATERVAADAATLAPALVVLGAAGLATIFGLETLVLSPAVRHPIRASSIGVTLLAIGAAAGVAGFRMLPSGMQEKATRELGRILRTLTGRTRRLSA